jgi:hypothetical protein
MSCSFRWLEGPEWPDARPAAGREATVVEFQQLDAFVIGATNERRIDLQIAAGHRARFKVRGAPRRQRGGIGCGHILDLQPEMVDRVLGMDTSGHVGQLPELDPVAVAVDQMRTGQGHRRGDAVRDPLALGPADRQFEPEGLLIEGKAAVEIGDEDRRMVQLGPDAARLCRGRLRPRCHPCRRSADRGTGRDECAARQAVSRRSIGIALGFS